MPSDHPCHMPAAAVDATWIKSSRSNPNGECVEMARLPGGKAVLNSPVLTGDAFVSDANGRLSFVARSDDMIISSGYNIAGPEVEAALLKHPSVAECGVVGVPDEARGMVVKAYVVVMPGIAADAALTTELQDHVKREIAPYKYPRAIEYVAQLPKTQTGKLQRFALRQMARDSAASSGIAAE